MDTEVTLEAAERKRMRELLLREEEERKVREEEERIKREKAKRVSMANFKALLDKDLEEMEREEREREERERRERGGLTVGVGADLDATILSMDEESRVMCDDEWADELPKDTQFTLSRSLSPLPSSLSPPSSPSSSSHSLSDEETLIIHNGSWSLMYGGGREREPKSVVRNWLGSALSNSLSLDDTLIRHAEGESKYLCVLV